MEKKIYCLIAGRCKCIKYIQDENTIDYESVMKKLMEVINKDASLKIMISGKSIILQQKDLDRNNLLCDIDEDDAIHDKSDVHVLLVPLPSSSTDIDINSLPIVFSENELSSSNGNISFIEATMGTSTERSVTSIDIDHDNLPSISNQSAQEQDLKEDDATSKQHLLTSKTIIPGPSTSKISQHEQKSISANSPLPSLTLDLQKKLTEDGVLKAQKYFINFWASYLWEVTNAKPTKFDYYNLATSIVQAYPELKGGSNECGIVRSQLSIWIRNHRYGLKKTGSIKRDHDGNSKLPTAQAVFVDNNIDIEKSLKELSKSYKKGINTAHWKQLLKITLTSRRVWIENEATRISDIIAKYPCLISYEMMFYEFLTMREILYEDIVKKIDVWIDKLTSFCNFLETNNN
ncbi:uncharacterized protein LOC141533669 [Cotesia typhae]|uniref:uncharacterized protein LOC141533669 n=1 Tax=Cotesia typhae TaxID=2053667 RepID=UPI003D68481E